MMKWISFVYKEVEHYGIYNDSDKTVVSLIEMNGAPKTLCEAIGQPEFMKAAVDFSTTLKRIKVSDVEWLAPIPRPTKNIFCIGKNYRDHAVEMGGDASIPEHPIIFTKAPTTVSGQNALIPAYESLTDSLDYEGELAVIIGKKGKEIDRENAFDYIFGYTVLNDVTARNIQNRHHQFFLGKSLDATCPMGPWIVTKEEIEDPHNLSIETRVNGEVRQQSNTSQLIFPIDEIIHVLSRGMTLEPGDIIATGTPSGVGYAMNPKRTLKAGDSVDITIEGVGTLTNNVQ
nr:fumarylacetoacetate hydrolase family protein [Domibacillus mangrovi]